MTLGCEWDLGLKAGRRDANRQTLQRSAGSTRCSWPSDEVPNPSAAAVFQNNLVDAGSGPVFAAKYTDLVERYFYPALPGAPTKNQLGRPARG